MEPEPSSWKIHPQAVLKSAPIREESLHVDHIRATENVSVEIWDHILCFSIACSLLPCEDDDYFHHHAVRDLDCVMVAEYKNSEQIKTRLRLVCRLWDKILDRHSDRLVQLTPDTPTGYWPPVKDWGRVVRLQGPHNILCCCKESCWPPFDRKGDALLGHRFLLPVPSDLAARIRKEVFPQLSNQCRAILWPGIWEEDLVDPKQFGSLVMLSQAFDDVEHAARRSTVISQSYPLLTHLEIWVPSLHNAKFDLHLPHLHTLRIFTQKKDANLTEAHASGTLDVGHWNLPVLRCISIWMISWTTAEVYAFNMLLEQVGKGLTELYMCDMTEDSSVGHPVITESSWSWLPSLRVLGTNLKQVSLMTAPRNGGRAPVNLLIDPETNLINHIPPADLLERIRQNWSLAPTGEVVVNERWSEMVRAIEEGQTWLGEGLSEPELEVLDILHAIGSGLQDSEGTPFQESVRRLLRTAIENQKQRARSNQ